MSISLRTALESEELQADETKERTLVMKGPLAEVYTQALDIAYAKNEAAQGQPAVESQAIDAAIAQKMAKLIVPEQDSTKTPASVVYGVHASEMTENEVVEVINELADKPEDTDFYLVIDATQPGPNGAASAPQERVVELSAAMETMVKACGGKVYRSFQAMVSDVVS